MNKIALSNSTENLRRLRYNKTLRSLVRETRLSLEDLVYPLAIRQGCNIKNPVKSMPGYFQLSLDNLEEEIKEICDLGIKSILVFGIPLHKDDSGSDSYYENGIVQQAIRIIKQLAPELFVISDLCFCQYTSHGHCGVIAKHQGVITIDNEQTLKLLAKQAVSHAQAGADMLAPSGMLDQMVKTIRLALDLADFKKLPILSYAVKYRSSMYGPFGEALDGGAKIGDRRTYQMDPSNSREAIREALFDIEEKADIIMVKPAHTYLDIIYRIKENFPYMPIAAYHVSGEYSMLKSAIINGYIEEKRAVYEVLTSIKRAGADFIFTYFAKDIARWSKEKLDFF